MCTFSYVSLRYIFICIITVYLIRFRECWHLLPLPMTLFRGHAKITLFLTHPPPTITLHYEWPLLRYVTLYTVTPLPLPPLSLISLFWSWKKTNIRTIVCRTSNILLKDYPPPFPLVAKPPWKWKLSDLPIFSAILQFFEFCQFLYP